MSDRIRNPPSGVGDAEDDEISAANEIATLRAKLEEAEARAEAAACDRDEYRRLWQQECNGRKLYESIASSKPPDLVRRVTLLRRWSDAWHQSARRWRERALAHERYIESERAIARAQRAQLRGTIATAERERDEARERVRVLAGGLREMQVAPKCSAPLYEGHCGCGPRMAAIAGSALSRSLAATPAREEGECTGLTASWCPRCGDCSCPRRDDGGPVEVDRLDDVGCPLHAEGSAHATPAREEDAEDLELGITPWSER